MKNIRSFLFTLTLTTIATPLGAMESQCMDVETITPKHILQAYAALSNELPQELVHYIFFGYTHISPLVDNVIKNCTRPSHLTKAIKRLSTTCCPDLSAQIVTIALHKTGISLCGIKGNNGVTALHYAALYGYTEVVNVLLAAARGNAWELICIKSYNGTTAFHEAAYYGHAEVVKVLLAATEDKAWELICMKNNSGCTALHYTADYTAFHSAEVIKVLLSTAGDKAWELICMGDNNGNTALDLANNETRQIMEQYRPDNQ